MHHALQRRRRRWSIRLYLFPALLALSMMLPKLGQGRFNADTGWYAAIAAQAWDAALERGDWGRLWTLAGYGGTGEEGTPYFNKPPLAFWIHGVVLHALGPTLLAARLPSVLAALGTVLLTVAAARELSGRRTAVVAGIVLALTLEFTRHARAFSLDMWQLMFFMGAVFIAARAVASGRGSLLVAAGVPIGLALMTKPLVGFIPLVILAIWLAWIGRWRWCGWLAAAALVALAIAAPWHISMAMLHGDAFVGRYFGHEIAGRAAGEIAGINAGAQSPRYYARQLLRQYWPWLITVALAAAAWARSAVMPPPRAGGSPWRGEAVRLAVLWTAVWLVLLTSFADKRPRYLLPLYPMGAWLSAVWLMVAAPRWAVLGRRAVERWAAPVAVVAAVAVAAAPLRLSKTYDPHYDVLFARVRDLGGDRLWEGGLPDGARGARVYLHTGRWPQRTRDESGAPIARPPEGALVMYHENDGWGPGESESVELRAGPITLSRVGAGGWRPTFNGEGAP